MTAALEGSEWSAARPGRTLPPGKTRYPLYRMLGGPQGRSGRAESLVPTGIRSRTFQPVPSRYTDWATGYTHTHTHIHTYIYIYIKYLRTKYNGMTKFKPELRSLQRNLFLAVLFEKAAIPHYSTYFYGNRVQNIHSLLPVLIIRIHSPYC